MILIALDLRLHVLIFVVIKYHQQDNYAMATAEVEQEQEDFGPQLVNKLEVSVETLNFEIISIDCNYIFTEFTVHTY